MGETNVIIGGKSFSIACDPGQEARVQQLGRYVDQRFAELSQGSGANNTAQMMVLTALVLADEIFDSREQLARATTAINAANAQPKQNVYQGLAPAEEKEITETIAKLATKVEKLSKRVAKS
jgi:cell division protein ZapA